MKRPDHNTYREWLHLDVDGHLPAPQRGELEQHSPPVRSAARSARTCWPSRPCCRRTASLSGRLQGRRPRIPADHRLGEPASEDLGLPGRGLPPPRRDRRGPVRVGPPGQRGPGSVGARGDGRHAGVDRAGRRRSARRLLEGARHGLRGGDRLADEPGGPGRAGDLAQPALFSLLRRRRSAAVERRGGAARKTRTTRTATTARTRSPAPFSSLLSLVSLSFPETRARVPP